MRVRLGGWVSMEAEGGGGGGTQRHLFWGILVSLRVTLSDPPDRSLRLFTVSQLISLFSPK